MVVLYDENEEIIGDVKYNDVLDFLNASNYQNGGVGRHLGFGQLEDGRFYLIYGTQWEFEQDRAKIVPARTIVIEAIKSESLSEIKDYPELMQIYEGEFDKTKPEKSKVFSIRIKLTETEAETNEKIEQLIQKVKDYRNLK